MTTSSALSAPDRTKDGHAVVPGAPGAHALGRAVIDNVTSVVRGRDAAVELVTCAILSGGHVLVEDVPGSGKTTMARAFSRSLGGRFGRIQGTADLLPSDLTGSAVWDGERRGFDFVPGPVFVNVLLVDELNRTPPRTQSALLEAMEEAAVTADGRRHALPDPFVVIATQNPIEQHGTFPLPEGQLDRFAVALTLGPLGADDEALVLREQLVRATVDDLGQVTTAADLSLARAETRALHLAEPVLRYVLSVVRATREHPHVQVGASARAALSLARCAQAHAVLAGRDFVTPDDVKRLAPFVLGHRIRVVAGAEAGHSATVIAQVLDRVPVPVG